MPVALKTQCFPNKYVISGKIKDSVVLSPRIAQWTLALLNHNVKVETVTIPPVMPYGIIVNCNNDICDVTNVNVNHEHPLFCKGD